MLRVLPAVIEIGLLLYCLIDCIQAPDGTVRNLPKWGWIVLIILVPWIGPVAYLIAGRPRREGVTSGAPWSPTGRRPDGRAARPAPRAPRGPDDDPDFLRDLNRQRRETTDASGASGATGATEATDDGQGTEATDEKDGEPPA